MFVWYVIGFYIRPYLETLRTWQLGLSSRKRCVWMIGLCAICIILFPCMLFLANIGCEWRGGVIPPLVFLGTFMGMLWSFCLANILNNLPFAHYLALPGICSFTIMAWHIGAFRFLSVLRVLVTDIPKDNLFKSYVHFEGGWPLIYCIIGVLLPTIGKIYWDKLISSFHKK